MDYNNFINKDFRNRPQATQNSRHNGLRWLLFAGGCAVIGAVLASTANINEDSIKLDESALAEAIENTGMQAAIQPEQPDRVRLKLPLPGNSSGISIEKLEQEHNPHSDNTPLTDPGHDSWQTYKVKRGDSLSVLFDRAGISPTELHQLMQLGGATDELRRIHPGDKIKLMSDNGRLLALNYPIDTVKYLQVERSGDELVAKLHKHEIEVRTAYASGEIESSLFLASSEAGLSQSLTMELANIFGWDIDFVLDIRKGDRFTVIYEQRFKDGVKIKDGNILAAEFVNQGNVHRALRYVDPVEGRVGYYSPDGHSLRKAFLRSPVNFSRISSGFTLKRYHPILHKFRSHKGVDYAARRGTPVRASGDGKVIFKGRKGGYGKTIILKHGSRYTTLYAHLNNYNRKVRSGSKVKQGQIIGYVGSTGLASGPHLHYEFRVNGVHRNPLTVKFPSTKPIPEIYRDNFELSTQGYVAQLDVLSRNALAMNEQQ